MDRAASELMLRVGVEDLGSDLEGGAMRCGKTRVPETKKTYVKLNTTLDQDQKAGQPR